MRVVLAVDKAIPQLVFHLSYPSHKTLQLCLVPFLLFVLTCRPGRRLVGIWLHVQRPLAGAGTKRTRFHILRMKTEGGGEKNNGCITR